jgi:exodeoxyribonuclease VIII
MIELIRSSIRGFEVPYEGDYSMSDAIGHSDLRAIASCPHRWRFGVKKVTANDAMKCGSLVDGLLFGVGLERFVVRPDRYTNEKNEVKPWNANANACKEWLADNQGYDIISEETKVEALKAVSVLKADTDIANLLNGAQHQCWLEGVFHDSDTGLDVTVRGLVDCVPSMNGGYAKFLADLKTTNDATASRWWRKCEDMWYHVQGALYLDLFNMATEQQRTGFLHVVQENKAPYEVARYELSDGALRLGRAQYKKALETYARCLASGQWQGHNAESIGWDLIEPDAYAEIRAGVPPEDSDLPW